MSTILEIKNISYQTNHQEILENINLSIESGDFITISGPSGGGKSTLLKIIAGLITSTSGEIIFDQKSIYDYPMTDYRKRVSYAVQAAQLFGQTVKDNLDFPYLVRNQNPNQNDQLKGLHSIALDDSFLDKSVTELSGGQIQRIALLRNLIFPPKILLLDEISTGLDEDTKKIIWNYIDKQRLANHITVLSVTHDQEEISKAHHLITIANGELIHEKL